MKNNDWPLSLVLMVFAVCLTFLLARGCMYQHEENMAAHTAGALTAPAPEPRK